MLGTVISSFEGPTQDAFSFVIKDNKGIPVRKDQFVSVQTEEGLLIARVINIRKTNRYFMSAESVRDYSSQASMNSIFPIDEWEFLVADALPLGILSDKLMRSTFPPSPGSEVKLIDPETLGRFLGFTEDGGVHLGHVEHHNTPAILDITRLLQKHVAILAMSGAGKSFLATVLIEELMQRDKGKLGIIIIDPHGEYVGISQLGAKIIEASKISIPVRDLSYDQLASLLPKSCSAAQKRELNRIVKGLRDSHHNYDFDTIIAAIESSDIKDNIKDPLVGWLTELNQTKLFNGYAYPDTNKLIPGETWVIDLSSITNFKMKQIVVSYIASKLFYLRKQQKIPPFVVIVEEAHNFVPESSTRENAMARPILTQIAREGRKFHASLCLISQRPVHLSTTVLSQCNTHIILRVTNPYDLEHIKESSEGITSETLGSITSLQVGQALIVGAAVNYPVFIKVKQKKTRSPHEKTLEEAALEFEQSKHQLEKDAEAFV